jgi:rhamnosyltransferase
MSITASLATVTVTYHPSLAMLRKQLAQLPRDALRIVVDNASPEPLRVGLRALVAEEGALLIENDANLGLAAATNIGITHALCSGAQRVLFLDQDTEPGATGVADLCAAHYRVHASDPRPSCIGPRLVDISTGLDHGFHQQRGWRWVRVWPPHDAPPVRCVNLNGSGTLVPREILVALGGLEEELFIDHVDTEWAFRVLAAGFGLYGAPGVAFRHRMGERTWRFWWWGWRIWPYRSPLRHRYLFRNAVRLMHRPYVPRIFKTWAVVKLMVTFCAHALFDKARVRQAKAMLHGVVDGWRAEHTGKTSD